MTRWLIDYDQTLANTQARYLQAMNERFGTDYVESDFTSWAGPKRIKKEHFDWVWSPECFMNEDFQESVEPLAHAIEGVHHLIANGDEAMVVSDRHSSLFEVTRDWLDKQGLDMVRLLFTRHKHSSLTDGNLTKQQAAWLYKLDGVIEDGPHHVELFAKKPHINRIFLIDMPYNQYLGEDERIIRVNGWKEIVEKW